MGKKVFVDLSHPFFGDMPLWPYFSKPEIAPMHSMAKGGVLTQTIKCTMHTGTHADAPRHVMERMFDGSRAIYSHELPVDAYCGDAVCLDIKVDRWKLIMPKDLEDAVARAGMKPSELAGMVVCLNTGMHRKFDDSKEYYHYSLGTGIDAGKWFVKHKVKVVAVDQQALDHPLHTSMGNNGTRMKLEGYSGKSICDEYVERVRRRSLCRIRQGPLHQGAWQKEIRREVRRTGSHRLLWHLGTLPQDHAGPRRRGRREPWRRFGQGEGQALPLLSPCLSAGTWATALWCAAPPRSTRAKLVPAEPRLYKYGAM